MIKPHALATEWYIGCSNDQERAKRKLELLSSRPAFVALHQIVRRKAEELCKASTADYDESAWAYKQAHKNGMQDVIDQFDKLLGSVIDHD